MHSDFYREFNFPNIFNHYPARIRGFRLKPLIFRQALVESIDDLINPYMLFLVLTLMLGAAAP
jgi:hypothetical protein